MKRVLTYCFFLGFIFCQAQNMTDYVIMQEYEITSDALNNSLRKWALESGNLSKDNILIISNDKDQINRDVITLQAYPSGKIMKESATKLHGHLRLFGYNVFITGIADSGIIKKKDSKTYKLKCSEKVFLEPREYEIIEWVFLHDKDKFKLVYMEIYKMFGNKLKYSDL